MKAIVIKEFGPSDVLRTLDVPDPTPKTGEVCIRTAYAGVNFKDVLQRRGTYKPKLPFILGIEGAGVIESVGPDVDQSLIGKRVAFSSDSGAYAERVCVSLVRTAVIPADINLELAAALVTQGSTAHYLIHDIRDIAAQSICVRGYGGVSRILIQLARSHASEIHVVSTRQSARTEALELGATHVHDGDKQVLDRSINIYFDGNGGEESLDQIRTLKSHGVFVAFGQSKGSLGVFAVDRLKNGSLSLTRPSLADHLDSFGQRMLGIFQAVQSSCLTPGAIESHSMLDMATIHESIENGSARAKFLMAINCGTS